MAKGNPYPVWAIQTARKPALRPPGSVLPEFRPSLTARVSSGMNVSCSGTASSPTRARKIQLRPQNFIRAKAYAAKAAIAVGMSVAGIAIMKLLKKLGARALAPSTARYLSRGKLNGGACAVHQPLGLKAP